MKAAFPVAAGIICWTRFAAAQTGLLTVDDCVRLALQAPSAVSIAQQERRIADYGFAAARSALLPQTQLSNGSIYNSPLRTSPAGPGAGSGGSSTGAFVALNGVHEYQSLAAASWEIDTSGRLRAALDRARADQQIAAADLAVLQRDLKRAVTAAFFRVLLTRRLAAANRDVLAGAQSFAGRTRAMFRAGEVAEADVVKAESQVAFLAQAVQAAELEAQIANSQLASFWTADVAAELRLADTLESQPPPDPGPEPQAFLARPEFRLLDAQRRGFQADYRRQRSFLFPQLALNFQYGIDANRLAVRDRGQAAFFSLNVPVFDWFRTRSLAQQLQLRTGQVDTRKQVWNREFSRDYQVALARVRSIYGQIRLAETQVLTSENNLKLSRIRYEGGEGPALDVVAAQTQLAQARTNYFTALADYAVARADLEVAAGR